MKKMIALLLIASFINRTLFGQTKWDLKRTVEYALANNISVKQANISSLQAEIDYNQNRVEVYPTATLSNDWGLNFGRRRNPTTGIFENTNSLYSSFSFNSSVNLFNFFSQKNIIAAIKLNAESYKASEEKAKNDITLRVANGYLLALEAKEQMRLNELQTKLTQEQLNVIRKRVEAGDLPEINAAEIEAQLASDSSALVTSTANTELQQLQLKAMLNLDAATPFDIETPDIGKISIGSLAELQPENVYKLALLNLPDQRIDIYKLLAAKKSRDAARERMFPSIGGFAGLSSNFYGPFQTTVAGTQTSYQETGLFAKNGSSIIPIYSPTFSGRKQNKNLSQIWSGYGSQLHANFGQNIGLGVSAALFNKYTAHSNWERAELNIGNLQLQKDLDNQTLKQQVYSAYNNALAAFQKQNAGEKALETAQRSYDISKKRFDVNLLTSFELITNQNKLFKAQIDLLLERYDYIFKMKVLEFYKGEGMRL